MSDQPGWASPTGENDPEHPTAPVPSPDVPTAPSVPQSPPPPQASPAPPPTWASQQPPAWGQGYAGQPPASGSTPPPAQPPPPAYPSYPSYPPPYGQQAPYEQQAPYGQPYNPYGAYAYAPPQAPKPGVIPLRPLGVGELLDGAISTVRAHPKAMLGLSAIVVAASQLIQLVVQWAFLRDLSSTANFDSSRASLGDVAAALSAAFLAQLISWLAQLVLTGVLTVVISRAVLGEGVDLGEAWRRVRGRIPALVGVSLLTGLIVLGVVVVCLLPGILSAIAGAPTGLTVLLFVLGGIAAAGGAIYLYVSLALSGAALVLERASVTTALGRSRRLVKGNWWRVLGVLILTSLIVGAITVIVSIPFSVLGAGGTVIFSGTGSTGTSLSFFALAVGAIGGIIAGTISYPFAAAVSVLLYIDQRMRREGLDIELARAAGVQHAPQPYGQQYGSTPAAPPGPPPTQTW